MGKRIGESKHGSVRFEKLLQFQEAHVKVDIANKNLCGLALSVIEVFLPRNWRRIIACHGISGGKRNAAGIKAWQGRIFPASNGSRMKVAAFLTEYAVVDRIINHLKLTFVADKPPPPHVFELAALADAVCQVMP